MSKNDKMYSRRVHRLVANAFIKNTKNYKEVNHIDGNKKNNKVENLEWCNRSQNMQHAVRLGLKPKKYKKEYKILINK